jgi:hypothetical protein
VIEVRDTLPVDGVIDLLGSKGRLAGSQSLLKIGKF